MVSNCIKRGLEPELLGGRPQSAVANVPTDSECYPTRRPSPRHAVPDHHAKSGSTRPPFYSGGKASSEANPYPLFKRERVNPDAPFEAGRSRMSPDLRGSGSNSGGNGASPPASTSTSSFRLRYSPEYSTYPYPWEFTREEQGARWAEASSVRRPMPVRGWNGHPSAT